MVKLSLWKSSKSTTEFHDGKYGMKKLIASENLTLKNNQQEPNLQLHNQRMPTLHIYVNIQQPYLRQLVSQ